MNLADLNSQKSTMDYPKAPTEPISILLVNLFYPEKHPTIGFPINVESLLGDIKGEFGDSVDVSLIDMQQPEVSVDNVLQKLTEKRFDILGLSLKTGHRLIAEQILDKVYAAPQENRPRYLMIGGYRPRVYHDEFPKKYPKILACVGEGEPTMRGMIEHIKGSISLEEIPNLVYMTSEGLQRTRTQQHDLLTWHPPGTGSLPFVLESGGVVYLETNRGCSWMGCTFCHRRFSAGTRPYTIPVEKVAENWANFGRLGVRNIYCGDDDFLMNNHAHGKALGQALINANANIEFWAQTTVDGILQLRRSAYSAEKEGLAAMREITQVSKPQTTTADSTVLLDDAVINSAKQALRTLKNAGLRRLFLGLESGSETQLIRYRKGVTATEGAAAVRLCRSVGIEVENGMIPFDPFATMEELQENVNYIRSNDLGRSTVKILNVMCIQKGIAAFPPTKKAGLLTGERDIDTFLYPFKFANARVGEIAKWVDRWHSDGVSEFTYALRRLIDADPFNPVTTKFLMEMRRLEFEFLAILVEGTDRSQDQTRYDQCIKQRFDILERCMKEVGNDISLDPQQFLKDTFEKSFSEGQAWMKQTDTADVMRL